MWSVSYTVIFNQDTFDFIHLDLILLSDDGNAYQARGANLR